VDRCLFDFFEDESFMRTVKYFLTATLALGLIASVYANRAEDTEQPKHTIKEIMNLANKKGLFKKVVDGKASEDEKKDLAALYADLGKNKPKKGSEDSWKEKTDALAAAAKAVAEDKPDALVALKKAGACKDCHSAHK
jgi:hypothetical protein